NSAQRYSMVTFWTSTKPASLRPSRNAATTDTLSLANLLLRNPITGIAGCCACAASGHAAARAAECSQQFPPSDGDCHTPLPCEVRKWNDTTSRACSLAVQGGQNAGCCRPASCPLSP